MDGADSGGVELGEPILGGGIIGCFLELAMDALNHFGGGFLGKGDGDDLGECPVGVSGEKLEVALDEDGGFARAGPGFDQHTFGDVEGLFLLAVNFNFRIGVHRCNSF